jgi:hypothetical protein
VCYGPFRCMTIEFFLATVIKILLTIGMLFFRYSSVHVDSNWPLVYYALLALYLQIFPEALPRELVFGMIVLAMLIRFEFLSRGFLKSLQWLESICLLSVLYLLTRHFI